MIKGIRHVVAGVALSPAGEHMGGMPVVELNKFISDIAKDYDEVQTHLIRSVKDEGGDPAFIQNEYIFIKYAEGTVSTKAK
jgi:hypothetical protein